MFKNVSLLKPFVLAALCAAAGASQAAVTVYTTQASFLAAVTSAATDSFDSLVLGGVTGSPLTRAAGSYSYTATSYNVPGASGDTFWAVGTEANPALSTNSSADSVTFSSFSSLVNAVGGNFYATDYDGNYVLGTLTLTFTDSTGAISTQTITSTSTSGFIGFVSTTGTAVSLVVTSNQSAAEPQFVTVDNLVLAVPEPQTYAMLLAGLGLVGLAVRRRG